MKHNRLILNELEATLVLWEDIMALSLLQKKVLASNKGWRFLLNQMGDFSTALSSEHYEKLRRALLSKTQFGPTEFLPNVPEVAIEWMDKVNLARSTHLNLEALSFFPYMLSQWIKLKKVFRIENDKVIPLISPKKRSYLHLLPCDAFVISFLEPLEIGFETSSLIKRYTSCIVVRSDKLIDTFWVPEGVELKSLRPRGRKLLKSAFKGNTVDEKHLKQLVQYVSSLNPVGNPALFTNLAFHIDKPLSFAFRAKKADGSVVDTYHDLYTRDMKVFEEHNGRFKETGVEIEGSATLKDSIRFHRFFFELLNGFCYLLSEIKPKNPTVVEHGKDTESNQPPQSFVWNEIPITKVDYLEESSQVQEEVKVSHGSGEKSPHVRRGHWRNVVKRDGTTERIWIEQMIIREDKLATEELKGSVTIIRQKRLV